MRLTTLPRLAALALTIASARAAGAQAPDAGRGIRLQAPDSIGGWRRVERKTFDDPSYGTMFRYARDRSLFADVFVYPGPDFDDDCDSACARQVLAREGDEFVGAFPQFVQRGTYEVIAVASDSALRPVPDARWRMGRHMRFAQRRGGNEEWSDFMLWYVPGYRMKLRATFPRDTAMAAAVQRFAMEVVPAIAGSEAESPRHMMIATTLAGARDDVYARVARLLAEQRWTIADSSRADGRLVTAPSWAWPDGVDTAKWRGQEFPGLRLHVALTPAGDSTRVEIQGESPVRAGWKDADAARTFELLGITKLAAALGEGANKK